MSAISLNGERRSLPRLDRAHPTTPAQKLRKRNAQWLFLNEVGAIDPATNRVRPWTSAEIADFCRCSTRLVQQGIASARQLRETLCA